MKKMFLLLVFVAAYIAAGFYPVAHDEKIVDVVAAPGATLWEIAEQNYKPNEIRCFDEFLHDMRKENGFDGRKMLQPGDRLVVRLMLKK